jgi:hypothetical protein
MPFLICILTAAINPLYVLWRLIIMILGCEKNPICDNLFIINLHVLLGLQYYAVFTIAIFGGLGALLINQFGMKRGVRILVLIHFIIAILGGTFYFVMNEIL